LKKSRETAVFLLFPFVSAGTPPLDGRGGADA
jgi:hypothetical protein